MTLENWSQKLTALVVGVLLEKILNKYTISLCIDGLACGVLGVVSFLGLALIHKSNNPEHRIRWRMVVAVFIFTSILGGAIGSFLMPWIGGVGSVLVTITISASIHNLPNAFNWGILKSLINSFVSIVTREKITDDEIRPIISAKKENGGTETNDTPKD